MLEKISISIDYVSQLSIQKKLLLILLLAISLRGGSYITHPYIHKDSALYLSLNYHDSSGNTEKAVSNFQRFPPALLFYMRGLRVFGSDIEVAYRLVGLILYCTVIFSLFYISSQFLTKESSLIVSFCYAVHPLAINYSHSVLRETIAFPCFFAAIACFIYGRENKKLYFYILAGLLVALCSMSRVEYGLSLLAGFILFQIVKLIQKEELISLRFKVLSSLSFIVPYTILILISFWYMKQFGAKWDPLFIQRLSKYYFKLYA